MELFTENLFSAATQVGVLYVIVAVGYICEKKKIFTENTARKTVDLLLYIITPCAIINSFINTQMNTDTLRKFLVSLGIGAATHIIGIAVSSLFFRDKNKGDNAVYKFAAIYGNLGFMALPLVQGILGSEGVFYCANGYVMFNIFSFTHGACLMKKGEEKLNIKKLIVNPGVISFLIGLPLFLFKIELPFVVSQPVSMLSAVNSPLGMLVFGTYLATTELKGIISDRKIYLVSLIKLVIMPLMCMGIYYLAGVKGALLTAVIISASVPSANNTFMFATKYDRNTSVASRTVAFVSLISILTMPVMIALTQLTW